MNLLIGSLLLIFTVFLIRKLIVLAFFFVIFALAWVYGANGLAKMSVVEQPTPTQIKVLSYEELKSYPINCKLKTQQLAELTNLQKYLNFDQDPDKLGSDDAIYDSRLKATIWYFHYGCEE